MDRLRLGPIWVDWFKFNDDLFLLFAWRTHRGGVRSLLSLWRDAYGRWWRIPHPPLP